MKEGEGKPTCFKSLIRRGFPEGEKFAAVFGLERGGCKGRNMKREEGVGRK